MTKIIFDYPTPVRPQNGHSLKINIELDDGELVTIGTLLVSDSNALQILERQTHTETMIEVGY